MRVLVLEPGYCPYIAFFDSAEEAVSKIIQGETECSRCRLATM